MRTYLNSFTFQSQTSENFFFKKLRRTCYDTYYPYKVLSAKGIEELSFEPITILYGGNGSGKSTALNIIAEKLNLERDALYNRSNFYEEYLEGCGYEASDIPEGSRIITSDDVFDYMINIRAINEGVDFRREELIDEALDLKYKRFRMQSLDDYDMLVKSNAAKRLSQSEYVRRNVMGNIQERSNGETGLKVFMERITENRLYLLDEPENSLSSENQRELASFIVDSARFYGCQFIIATHSPFLLSMSSAKIFNFDASPVGTCQWTNLPSVRSIYELIMENIDAFQEIDR